MLQCQINIIRIIMKNSFILCMFGIVVVCIGFYILRHTLQNLTLTKIYEHHTMLGREYVAKETSRDKFV
jgi:hypothetical protein